MSVDWNEAGETVHRVRRFRRAVGDGIPFVPYGLLPLLGLFLLTLVAWNTFAKHSVENVVRRTAERTITETGADWATVSVSGQWVTVGGVPPTPESGERLVEAIRQARAPTWLGLARPATRVRGNFGTAVRPGEAGPASLPADGTTATAPVASVATPDYVFRLTDSKLSLSGNMPDIATRDAVIAAANRDLPERIREVENNLTVLGRTPPEGFRNAALRGLETIKLCDAGSASFANLKFDLNCELPRNQAERVRALASAALDYGAVGNIELLIREEVASCEDELRRLLNASLIEFETGSDRIAASKVSVLDLTARAAADCPGTLRVEGHTDNTGGRAINEALSLRRAEAVRAALIQRGISPSRIVAAGYGPARPIADNATEEGRAQNRRIEIKIVRPGE